METDTGWSRAAGESTGRWQTIRARMTGRATVPDSAVNGHTGSHPVVPPPASPPFEWRTAQSGVAEVLIAELRRQLGGPRVIAFANPKGGVHKTTATVLAAATIGSVRGRGVLAWDDNELRGTLGLRAGSARHARTIRHLVTELAEVEVHERIRPGRPARRLPAARLRRLVRRAGRRGGSRGSPGGSTRTPCAGCSSCCAGPTT